MSKEQTTTTPETPAAGSDLNRWQRFGNWSKSNWIVLTAIAVGLAFAFLTPSEWWYAPRDTAQVEGASVTYACPMHPHVQSQDPRATCPECGMDLEPVRDTDVLSSHDQWMIGLSTVRVEQVPLMRRVRVLGRLTLDETRLAHVSAWAAGRIEQLYANTRGEAITKGEPLLTLYSPQLYGAQEEYHANLRAARTATGAMREQFQELAESSRQRLRLLGLTAEQIDAIETEGPQYTLAIPAPQDGVIVERHVEQGLYVQEGTRLLTVADLRTLWLLLDVHERDATLVREGQRVRINSEALPGYEGHGWIDFIEPFVDERTRTARVRVTLPNLGERRFKPGMVVTAEIEAALGEDLQPVITAAGAPGEAVPLRVLPAAAVLDSGTRTVVYVLAADTHEGKTFELREVTVGPRLRRADDPDDHTLYRPILRGLATGDVVALGGAFLLDSQAQIRGRPSLFFPEGQAAPPAEHDDHVH